MANKEILPHNKQLEFHAIQNHASASKRLKEIYEDNHDSFVNIDREFEDPLQYLMFYDYSTSIVETIPKEDLEQANHAGYQGLLCALALAETLYPKDEMPEIELGKNTASLSPKQIQKFVEQSTLDYMTARPTLSALIDSHVERIDPSREHLYIGSTMAAFVLMQIEETYSEDYQVTINGQFGEITGYYGAARQVSENDAN